MSVNIKRMALKTNQSEEELKIQADIYRYKNLERYAQPRKNTQMMKVMTDICGTFDRARKLNPKLTKLQATQLTYLYNKYSPNTIVKAKRRLGIKSKSIEKQWWWTPPLYTPEESLSNEHIKKLETLNNAEIKLKEYQKHSLRTLAEIMKGLNYCDENVEVTKAMRIHGYSKGTTYRAKSDLGIATQKVKGRYLWIWGPKEVKEWLLTKLSHGPMPKEDIFTAAERERSWRREVVTQAMLALSEIKYKFAEHKMWWYDINHIEPEEYEPEPEVVNLDEWADVPEE